MDIKSGIELLSELICELKGRGHFDSFGFNNEVFIIRNYCWCDGEDPGHEFSCPPNFECGDFQVDWYKHLGRIMEYEDISAEEWRKIMIKCLQSLA